MDRASLAAMLDQTLLKPDVTPLEASSWLAEQRSYGFASVCVAPRLIAMAADTMRDTDTVVCTVVGFPLGYAVTEAKAYEAIRAVSDGALEIDMVLPVGELIGGQDLDVVQDIAAVVAAVSAASDGAGLVKVILETGYLDAAAIRRGCAAAEAAGADFVKTSTGFGPRGASVEDVALMRAAVGDRLGIKAAGSIRTWSDLGTKSNTPAWMASSTCAIAPSSLRMINGRMGSTACRRRKTSMPFMSGMLRSEMTRSRSGARASSTAWSPSCAVTTVQPMSSRNAETASKTMSESSMSRIFPGGRAVSWVVRRNARCERASAVGSAVGDSA